MTRDARHDPHHVDVTHSQAELDSMLAEARKAGADSVHMTKMFGADRIAFIRQAAIALYAGALVGPADCWLMARLLWDAKPEDC